MAWYFVDELVDVFGVERGHSLKKRVSEKEGLEVTGS